MREVKSRQFHSSEFKAKVGLEALRGVKAINEIGIPWVNVVYLQEPFLK